MSMDWSYAGRNGPDVWARCFPAAGGPNQSPVDIQPVNLQRLSDNRALKMRYTPEETNSIINTGYSWKVDANGNKSELTGGPLEDVYVLKQLHCHWGDTDDEGSEHTVGGKYYSGELHFVHWNCTKYDTFEEATQYPDGLCVLAVFLTPGDNNDELIKIINHLPEIIYKGDTTKMNMPLNPAELMPANSGYWTYMGSLTTPPCTECVIWIIFKEPIEVSCEQLEVMRSLRSHPRGVTVDDDYEGMIRKNFRPTVPLGERVIRDSRRCRC